MQLSMAGKRKKHCAAGQGRQSAALLLGSLSTCDARCTSRRCGRRAALPAGGAVCLDVRRLRPARLPGHLASCRPAARRSGPLTAPLHCRICSEEIASTEISPVSVWVPAVNVCPPGRASGGVWPSGRALPSMAALSSPSGLSGSVMSDGCAPVVCSVVSPVASPSGFSGSVTSDGCVPASSAAVSPLASLSGFSGGFASEGCISSDWLSSPICSVTDVPSRAVICPVTLCPA